MSLSRGELNPLGVLGQRRLSFIPEHFCRIAILGKDIDKLGNHKLDIKLLDHWINFNLNSRYSLKRSFILDKNRKMIEALEIGIEDPKESLILLLGCPYIQDYNKEKI